MRVNVNHAAQDAQKTGHIASRKRSTGTWDKQAEKTGRPGENGTGGNPSYDCCSVKVIRCCI